jgi:hypothetical protein
MFFLLPVFTCFQLEQDFKSATYVHFHMANTGPPLLAFFPAIICAGTIEPKGPAGFAHFAREMPLLAPTVAVQVMPAGIEVVSGKSTFFPLLRPFVPGTCVLRLSWE